MRAILAPSACVVLALSRLAPAGQITLGKARPAPEIVSGNEYYDAGNLEAAIAEWTHAFERFRTGPNASLALENRGRAYRVKGELEKALADHTQAVTLAPKASGPYVQRGEDYRLLRNSERALADAETAVSLNPKDPMAWALRGLLKSDARDADGALVDYNRSIDLAPDEPAMRRNRGFHLLEHGEPAAAAVDLTHALEKKPESRTYYRRGEAYTQLKRYGDAARDFEAALKLAPNDAEAWRLRAALKVSTNDHPGALADLARAIELQPKSPLAWAARGELHLLRDEYEAALTDLTQARLLEPKRHRISMLCAGVRYQLGHFEDAVADATDAVKANQPGALMDRGRAYLALGQFHEAIADYDAQIKLRMVQSAAISESGHFNPATAYLKRAQCRQCLGDARGAAGDAERCIELAPEFAAGYDACGLIRLSRQEWLSAAADFDTALRLDPREFGPAIHRCVARIRQGDLAEAQAELRRALENRAADKAGDWLSTLARFLLGEIDEPALFKAAGSARLVAAENPRAAAHYAIGVLHLTRGDKAGAAESFRACTALKVYHRPEFALANAELSLLDAK